MNNSGFIKIPNVSHNECFGCGPANERGLKMEFQGNSTMVCSELAMEKYMAGWNGVVHGGILSTILDEVMAWGAIFLTERFILTRTMTINYHRPTFITERLRAEAEIEEHSSDREVVMRGRIINSKGEVTVSSTGTFALFTSESLKKMNIVDPEWIDEFRAIMDSHKHLKD